MERAATSRVALDPEAIRSILICSGTELLGDGIIKLPFLHAIRQTWPRAAITWLTMSGRNVYAGPLAEIARPYIDEIIEDAGIGARWGELLTNPLPGRRFDLVIDTQRRLRTTAILRRVAHGTFVSGTVGFLLSDRRPLDWEPEAGGSMVAQLLRLVAAARGEPPRLDYRVTVPDHYAAAATAALPDNRYVGFAPGAGGKHKCWPLDRFLSVARDFEAQGIRPAFLLGPAEQEMTATIQALCPAAALPLGDGAGSPLFALACGQRLTAAVANDSGTGHLLAAAGVPLLSLFGPTSPAKFAPFVCRGRVLRTQEFGGSGDMASIPASAVGAALADLLA